MRNTRALGFLVLATAIGACGDDSGSTDGGRGSDSGAPDARMGGPIDGSWRVDSFSCDGVDQMIPMLTVNIDDTMGTFVIAIPTVCTSTLTETYSYPSASSILITPTANDCAPDGAACAPVFGGATTCPTPPPTQFDHALSGTSLTFMRTSEGPPVDTCPTGQTVEYQMTRL